MRELQSLYDDARVEAMNNNKGYTAVDDEVLHQHQLISMDIIREEKTVCTVSSRQLKER